MPAPATAPHRRDPRTVATIPDYPPAAPVWVWAFRSGSWRPGVILQATPLAAMVRYRQNEGTGTTVDTVTATNLANREEPDPYLDPPNDQ